MAPGMTKVIRSRKTDMAAYVGNNMTTKTHLEPRQISFLVPGRGPGEDTGARLGPDPQKTQKDNVCDVSFWTIVATYGGIATVIYFTCFLNLSSSIFLRSQACF